MAETKDNSWNIGKLLVMVFFLFLTLKLAGIGRVANWSWWAVFAPLWVPVAIGIAILIVVVSIWFIKFFLVKKRKNKFSKYQELTGEPLSQEWKEQWRKNSEFRAIGKKSTWQQRLEQAAEERKKKNTY